MKRFTTILFVLSACMMQALPQNPKWFKKAHKAVFSIMTLDADGRMIGSGTGFFTDEKGAALANYDLFKHAAKAKIIGSDGKEYEVDAIIGASSLYDIVKFRVKTDKKTPFLTVADRIGVNGEQVFIMPYPTKEHSVCLEDTLKDIQKFNGEFGYYTLHRRLDEQYVNCPVMSEEGEVLGMIQKNAGGQKAAVSYAISTSFGNTLALNAMSAADNDLNAIKIRKVLPSNEQEAQTFLFMIASRSDSTTYNGYLNEYAEMFPDNHNSYVQRADFYMAHGNYEAAEADMDKAAAKAQAKDEVCYSFSKMLYELNLKPGYNMYKDWNMNKALLMAEEAYAANPLPLYTLHEGNILYALKEYEKAYEKFFSLRTTNMRSANTFLYAAQCKRMSGADTLTVLALQDSAVACFDKPYHKEAAPALLERANTKLSLGRYREAVLDLNEYELLMRNEVNDLFYYRREQAEMQCRMFQQAIDDIDRAIRMKPGEALYHAERAVVYYRIGETEEAIRSAREAIKADPDFTDAYRILGICLLETGKKEEAIGFLQKAKEMGDESAGRILEQNTP